MNNPENDASRQGRERATAFFREIAARKVERPPVPAHYARNTALGLGAVLGLAYGLTAQFCNSLVSPSIPFSHYPFGSVGNIVASAAGFTLIAWIVSLPRDFSRGALFGAFAAVAVLELRALLIGVPLLAVLVSPYAFFTVLGLFIELIVALVVMLIVRFTIDTQTDYFDRPIWSWPRSALPLILLIAAAGLGLFSLYPADVTAAMRDTNALIQRGLTASAPGDLPAGLQNKDGVQDFLPHAQRPYTLELGEYETFLEDPLAGTQGYAITIIARFKGGYAIACLYEDRLGDPACKSYGPTHAPPRTDFRANAPLVPG